MRNFSLMAACASLAIGAATPGQADISAEDVWTNLQAPVLALGGRIEADATRAGDTLKIGETVIRFALPFDAGTLSLTSTGFDLRAAGDGTVTLVYPPDMSASFRLDGPDGILASADLTMTDTAYVSTASGSPGDISYDYSLNGAKLRLDGLVVPEAPGLSVDMTGTMDGASGRFRIVEGEFLRLTAEGENGTMTYDMRMTGDMDIESHTTQRITGGTSAMTLDIPAGKLDILNLSQSIRDGFALSLTAAGGQTYSTSTSMLDGQLIATQSYGYTLDDLAYQIDKSGLRVGGTNSDIHMEMDFGPDFPVPITARADAVSGALGMPLARTDGPADASLSMGVSALTLDDGAWSMIDPSGQLPRDPLDLNLDMGGRVEFLQDILDVNALMAMGPDAETPVLLHALTLRALALDALGASLRGQGAFTFDNADLTTFDGMPAPDGTLELEMSGVNRLIDTLALIGMLSDDQATSARMMMGMFATPGDAPDSLTATILIKPDGQILANGQRLR